MYFYVYKHTTPNGKVYIGITQQDINKRWRNQGNGYKKNKHFYSAITLYGWENIKHEILYEGLTQEQAEQKEIELIALYKSNQREYGYNVAAGGGVNKGYHLSEERKEHLSKINKGKKRLNVKPLSEETKQKLRLANLGKKLSEEAKLKMSISKKGQTKSQEFREAVKKREQSKVDNILQVDLNGNIVNIFNSIQEAARITNSAATKICQVCKGKRNTANGFIWLYERDKNIINERLNKYENRCKYRTHKV